MGDANTTAVPSAEVAEVVIYYYAERVLYLATFPNFMLLYFVFLVSHYPVPRVKKMLHRLGFVHAFCLSLRGIDPVGVLGIYVGRIGKFVPAWCVSAGTGSSAAFVFVFAHILFKAQARMAKIRSDKRMNTRRQINIATYSILSINFTASVLGTSLDNFWIAYNFPCYVAVVYALVGIVYFDFASFKFRTPLKKHIAQLAGKSDQGNALKLLQNGFRKITIFASMLNLCVVVSVFALLKHAIEVKENPDGSSPFDPANFDSGGYTRYIGYLFVSVCVLFYSFIPITCADMPWNPNQHSTNEYRSGTSRTNNTSSPRALSTMGSTSNLRASAPNPAGLKKSRAPSRTSGFQSPNSRASKDPLNTKGADTDTKGSFMVPVSEDHPSIDPSSNDMASSDTATGETVTNDHAPNIV